MKSARRLKAKELTDFGRRATAEARYWATMCGLVEVVCSMQQRRSMGLAYRVLFVMELVGLEDTNQGSALAQDAAKRNPMT